MPQLREQERAAVKASYQIQLLVLFGTFLGQDP